MPASSVPDLFLPACCSSDPGTSLPFAGCQAYCLPQPSCRALFHPSMPPYRETGAVVGRACIVKQLPVVRSIPWDNGVFCRFIVPRICNTTTLVLAPPKKIMTIFPYGCVNGLGRRDYSWLNRLVNIPSDASALFTRKPSAKA